MVIVLGLSLIFAALAKVGALSSKESAAGKSAPPWVRLPNSLLREGHGLFKFSENHSLSARQDT